MDAWKKSDFTADRADFIQCTSIRTNLINRNHMTDNFFGEMIQAFRNIGTIFGINFFEMGFRFFSYFFHMGFTGELIWIKDRFFKRSFSIGINSSFNLFRNFREDQCTLRLSYFFNNLLLECHQFFNGFMSKHNSVKDIFFRRLLCTAFYHQNSCFRTCNSNIQSGYFELFLRRIDDKLPVNTAHTDTRNRSVPRDIGNPQRSRCAKHSAKFRRIIIIYGKNCCHHMYIIAAPLIK